MNLYNKTTKKSQEKDALYEMISMTTNNVIWLAKHAAYM